MSRQRAWCAVLVLAVGSFAVLATDLVLRGPASGADLGFSSWLALHRSQPLTLAMQAVTQMHSTVGIDAMLAVAVATLLLRSEWRSALWLVACVQGAMLFNVLLKETFHRMRPDAAGALVHLTTYSFPSGHALASTVWWGCVVMLCARRWPASAPWLLGLGSAMVLLTCASRVYLGAHYLTDVAAGVSEGLAWIAAWALAASPRGRSQG